MNAPLLKKELGSNGVALDGLVLLVSDELTLNNLFVALQAGTGYQVRVAVDFEVCSDFVFGLLTTPTPAPHDDAFRFDHFACPFHFAVFGAFCDAEASSLGCLLLTYLYCPTTKI